MRWWLSGALWCVVGLVAAGDEPGWGLPERWLFQGVAAYPASEIQRALAVDLEILVAERDRAEPERFAQMVAERVLAGYRHGGYLEARVAGTFDSRRGLVITIAEGPRYLRAGIEITGLPEDVRAAVIRDLTAGQPPADAVPELIETPTGESSVRWINSQREPIEPPTPLWKPGAAARDFPGLNEQLHAVVKLTLSRWGYLEPTFTVAVVAEAGATTLRIDVREPGPLATVGEVVIEGLSRETDEGVRRYLRLEPGTVLAIHELARIERELVASGRFYTAKAEVIAPPFGDGPCQLRIIVKEAPYLPSLGVEPDTMAAAALRAASWLHERTDGDWDFQIRYEVPETLRPNFPSAWRDVATIEVDLLVVGNRGAGLATIRFTDALHQLLWAQHLRIDAGRLTWLNPQLKRRLTLPMVASQGQIIVDWAIHPPDAEDRVSTLTLGVGMVSQRDASPWRVRVAPLAILANHDHRGQRLELVGDRLIWRGTDGFHAEFAATTGALIELTQAPLEGLALTIKPHAARYDELRTSLEPLVEACPPVAEDQLLRAGVTMLLDECLLHAEAPACCAPLRQLIEAGGLRRMEHWSPESLNEAPTEDRFTIPVPAPTNPGPMAWLRPGIHLLLGLHGRIFPPPTAGWVAGREAALHVAGPPGRPPISPWTLLELLDEAQAGPLTYLLAAEYYGLFSPPHAELLAQAGLDPARQTRLRTDLALAGNEASLVGQLLRGVVETLLEQDAAALDALLESWKLRPETRRAFRANLARFRSEPWEQAIPSLLEDLYPELWQSLVEAELLRLSGRGPAPQD
jgi:hypothetical protein